MKRIIIFLAAVSGFVLPLNLNGQDNFAGKVEVVPLTLAEQDGTLLLEMKVNIKADAVNRRQGLRIVPELYTATDSLEFPYVLVNGRQKERLYKRRLKFRHEEVFTNFPLHTLDLPYSAGKAIDYRIVVPYQTWMDEAKFRLHYILESPANKQQLYTAYNADVVALEPREPYQVSIRVNYITPEPEQKQRRMQGQAFLDFPAGRSVIIPSYRRNPEELAKIANTVYNVTRDPDVQISGLYIEGFASPEGSYALNERLSRERSEALRAYMIENLGLPGAIFSVSSVAEDWDGLRLLVEESDLVRKAEVLAIIDGTDLPDRKEQLLRSLGWPWTEMNNRMFPQLRRVEYQIDFTVKDYSVEEARNLAGKNPELLSHKELFTLAHSYTEGSPERNRIFEIISRNYPDDTVAIINSAAEMLRRGEDATAKRYLDRVAEDPRAFNNLGVYWLRTGELEKAEKYLTAASLLNVEEAGHNLRELEKKRNDDKQMERYKR